MADEQFVYSPANQVLFVILVYSGLILVLNQGYHVGAVPR